MRISAFVFVLVLASLGQVAEAATFAPDPVQPSSLRVRAIEVSVPVPGGGNLASPVAIDGTVHVVDQAGRILRETTPGTFEQVFDANDLPDLNGTPVTGGILNIADGPGKTVYASLLLDDLPSGAPAAVPLPQGAANSTGTSFQVIYRYTQQDDGSLTDETPLVSFEMTAANHFGGGMIALDDGKIIYALGDSQRFNTDGFAFPQDENSHLGSLVVIDGTTGDFEIAAKGVRNVQRLTRAGPNGEKIAFADIGSTVAEEINVVSLADILDTDTKENFGWGRNADGNAREGTFYIDQGVLDTGNPPIGIADAPVPESGFIQPFAQFGRDDRPGLFAVSGPVVSESAFDLISALFGDLFSGDLFATTAPLEGDLNSVFAVEVEDEFGVPTSLAELVGGGRVDPRFFNFANGDPGVLLEATGTIYRLEEVPTSVIPLPAPFALLLAGICALGGVRAGRARNAQP